MRVYWGGSAKLKEAVAVRVDPGITVVAGTVVDATAFGQHNTAAQGGSPQWPSTVAWVVSENQEVAELTDKWQGQMPNGRKGIAPDLARVASFEARSCAIEKFRKSELSTNWLEN